MAASSSSHAWEQEHHPWDEESSDSDIDPRGWDVDSDDDATDWSKLTPEQMGDELAARLLSLQNSGSPVTAKAVCCLAFFAKGAGAAGFVGKLAHHPEASSGHYQRHLDAVLHFSEDKLRLYEITCPGHARHDKEMVQHTISAMPLHEELARELAENADEMKAKLHTMVNSRELPDDYYEHPIVRANPGEAVYPLSLYLDGIAHSKVDNVLGITISNMVTGTRHLCIALRKSLLCRCGRKGRCTLWPM